MEKKKKTILILSILIIATIPIPIVLIYFPSEHIVGERKAFIVCSANDFYRKEGEPDFNDGFDGNFNNDHDWGLNKSDNGYGGQDNSIPGPDSNPGVVRLIANTNPNSNGFVHLEYIYNWTNYYPLINYALYNFTAWVNIQNQVGVPGVRIGLRWLNSSNEIVRTDWSNNISTTSGLWISLNTTGTANNISSNILTQLYLVLSVEGVMDDLDEVWFDDAHVEKLFPPPASSSPITSIDTDGFPAQALQVYWTLKYHGYADDNIFFMLYHTGDSIIDINANDSISNDLTNAIIDVEDDYVNATRFKEELNVSISGSFASTLRSKDQLVIFMIDHGSNTVLPNNNATFHFEADNSYITEFEFYELIKDINVERLMINVDFCYSGNFLNQNENIGTSWYNIPNSILISSSSDNLSWYWRDNSNLDNYAGSWFFHQFWYQLNQSASIEEAFNFAMNFIPIGQSLSVGIVQLPLIHDNIGINQTWSFNGPIQL
ncbi:MAG: hypothetical protein KGD63_04800 [Candidatus Lokiarchaeota archaeon]|nr:hypothetical protein [Candidatus Lokiarchaeota archaeon]